MIKHGDHLLSTGSKALECFICNEIITPGTLLVKLSVPFNSAPLYHIQP